MQRGGLTGRQVPELRKTVFIGTGYLKDNGKSWIFLFMNILRLDFVHILF